MKNIFKRILATASVALLTACGGGGGGGVPVVAFTPIKAQPLRLSSYENKILSVEAMGQLSLMDNFSKYKTDSKINWLSNRAQQYFASNTWAYGDFFGDGSYALIAHTFEYDFTNDTVANTGRIHFYSQGKDGWEDKTALLLDNNSGCLHPRKAIVSDFNLDGKPDIFINCTGVDAPPFDGEDSLLLLSSSSGKYEKKILKWAKPGTKTYTHGSSAADMNGDGLPDIVVTDLSPPMYNGNGVLINKGNGSFEFNEILVNGSRVDKTAYTAELIKVDGRSSYDLFLSGHGSEDNNYLPQVFVNDGSGKFIESKTLPVVPGYGLALDAIYKDGYFYILRTTDTGSGLIYNDNFYSAMLLQKVKYPEMTLSSTLYSFKGIYANSGTWINWIGFNGGNVVSLDADYALKVPK